MALDLHYIIQDMACTLRDRWNIPYEEARQVVEWYLVDKVTEVKVSMLDDEDRLQRIREMFDISQTHLG